MLPWDCKTVATRWSSSPVIAILNTALTKLEMVWQKLLLQILILTPALGTLDVRVRANWLIPASVLSRFSIICAILRQLHLILWTYFTSEVSLLEPNAFVVDQLSAGLPWLAYLYPDNRILFYCHFPDLLLAQGRSAWWKSAYRVPFDFLEEWSMSFADSVAVNSGFTKSVVSKVWPELVKKEDLQIVYPCVDIKEKKTEDGDSAVPAWNGKNILLSINRFEKKKDIGLAIKAYAGLGKHGKEGARLVLAGLLFPTSPSG
jgi:alpha-1,3/alpha-1,6-mannosyltransferase